MCKYTKLSGSLFRLAILAMYIRTAFYRYFGTHLVTKTPVFSPPKHNFVPKNMWRRPHEANLVKNLTHQLNHIKFYVLCLIKLKKCIGHMTVFVELNTFIASSHYLILTARLLQLPTVNVTINRQQYLHSGRCQWPRCLRCSSAAERLLGSWFESRRGHGCLSLVSVLWVTGLCDGADPSSWGVLPTVVCVWVWSSKNYNLDTYCE
jgi:hypothetical protein